MSEVKKRGRPKKSQPADEIPSGDYFSPSQRVRDEVSKQVEQKSLTLPDGDPVFRAVCHYRAFGMSDREIARITGHARSAVKQMLSSQSLKKEVMRLQDELYKKDAQKMFMTILPAAVQTALKLMKSSKVKDSVRSENAFRFMDRALGKPKQTIENDSGLLRDILRGVDSRRSERPEVPVIDVTPSPVEEKVMDPNRDPLEDLL